MSEEQKPYWQQLRDLKLAGTKSNKELKAEKSVKSNWYKRQIAQAPVRCENCNCSLRPTMAVNEAAVVAHILSKTKVPSVAFAEQNRMFLCGQCHDAYDKANSEEIEDMQVFPTALQRVKTFLKDVPANERRHIPTCFL